MEIEIKARTRLNRHNIFDAHWFSLIIKYRTKGSFFYASHEVTIFDEEDSIDDFHNKVYNFLSDYENNMRKKCVEVLTKKLKNSKESKNKELKDLINEKGNIKFNMEIK